MMDKLINLVGRILIAQIFLVAGINKISGYAGTQGYMEAMGIPGGVLPLVIALELGGAAALIAGWKTRWTALVLAAFSLLAAVIFHADFADQMQTLMFMKNFAIAGGLMVLAGYPMERTVSVDGRQLQAG